LVEAYRARPGRYGPAAKAAGVNERTAKRYWETGFPAAPDIRAKPIAAVIAEEQEFARSRMVELQRSVDTLVAELEAKRRQEVQAKAQLDVSDTRVQEAQLIRMARGATTGLLVTLTNLSKSAARVGVRVAKNLDRLANDPADMSRGEMVDMVRTVQALTGALRSANDAGRQAMDMERMLLGEPTSIVAHVHLTDVTVEEAERRIQAGMRALQRAKEKGLVVEGKIIAGPGALSAGSQTVDAVPKVSDPPTPRTGGVG
jgi:hypothetical protein